MIKKYWTLKIQVHEINCKKNAIIGPDSFIKYTKSDNMNDEHYHEK